MYPLQVLCLCLGVLALLRCIYVAQDDDSTIAQIAAEAQFVFAQVNLLYYITCTTITEVKLQNFLYTKLSIEHSTTHLDLSRCPLLHKSLQPPVIQPESSGCLPRYSRTILNYSEICGLIRRVCM